MTGNIHNTDMGSVLGWKRGPDEAGEKEVTWGVPIHG